MDVTRRIRAGAGAPKHSESARKAGSPVLVALVHEILNAQVFETLVDLTEVTKRRAARLRIPYGNGLAAAAIATVAHLRPVVAPITPRPRTPERARPTPAPMTRCDAALICQERGITVKGFANRETDRYATDAERANRLRRQAAAMERAL